MMSVNQPADRFVPAVQNGKIAAVVGLVYELEKFAFDFLLRLPDQRQTNLVMSQLLENRSGDT